MYFWSLGELRRIENIDREKTFQRMLRFLLHNFSQDIKRDRVESFDGLKGHPLSRVLYFLVSEHRIADLITARKMNS